MSVKCPGLQKETAETKYYIFKETTMDKVIAIDFDGCLCTDEYPRIGKPNWFVINLAKKHRSLGARLILWTCREGELLEEAVKACKEWGLKFDAVNENLPDWKNYFGSDPRKIGATEYWDDRARLMTSTEHDVV